MANCDGTLITIFINITPVLNILTPCQVAKLCRHMSGHVQTKLEAFEICKSLLAFWSMIVYCMHDNWCYSISKSRMWLLVAKSRRAMHDYERARSARSFFFNLGRKSEMSGQPAVVTLLRGLCLSNHETD